MKSVQIIDTFKEEILAKKIEIASFLPLLYQDLVKSFGIADAVESNPWALYTDSGLVLYSSIVLKGNPSCFRSLADVKNSLFSMSVSGKEEKTEFTTYSLDFLDGKVSICAYLEVPYLFVSLKLAFSGLDIEDFDPQIIGKDYFDFMLLNGLVSMCKGELVYVSKKSSDGNIANPDLYSSLYERDERS